MNKFDKIIKDIKSVKIQGATHIALAGMHAYLLKHDKNSVKKILNTRPTEPLLQTAISILESVPEKDKINYANTIKKYIEKSEKKIADFGSRLIKNHFTVFIHCHSTTVMEVLKRAKKQSKHFTVYISTAHPLYQGKLSAKELAKHKIHVVMISDLTVETFVDKADIVFFGADAIINKGIINKIGTSIIAKEAHEKKIPVYCTSISWKYTKKIPKIEIRDPKELFNEKSKYISEINPAFDFTDKKFITEIITEFGIEKYDKFLKRMR